MYEEGYQRYGMISDDWRHLNDYWRRLYGADYPYDRESYRNYERAFETHRGPQARPRESAARAARAA
jgi:hypothetical protein